MGYRSVLPYLRLHNYPDNNSLQTIPCHRNTCGFPVLRSHHAALFLQTVYNVLFFLLQYIFLTAQIPYCRHFGSPSTEVLRFAVLQALFVTHSRIHFLPSLPFAYHCNLQTILKNHILKPLGCLHSFQSYSQSYSTVLSRSDRLLPHDQSVRSFYT